MCASLEKGLVDFISNLEMSCCFSLALSAIGGTKQSRQRKRDRQNRHGGGGGGVGMEREREMKTETID